MSAHQRNDDDKDNSIFDAENKRNRAKALQAALLQIRTAIEVREYSEAISRIDAILRILTWIT